MNKRITKYALTAVFAAMVFVGTLVIQISIPATGGYVNIGDAIIIITAWAIGGIYAGIAAGFGAGLVDAMFYPVYAPGTVVIKFIMGIAAFLIIRRFKNSKVKYAGIVLAAVVSEAIMVLGYLFYEGVVLGLGAAAVAGVVGNLIQGAVSIGISVAVIAILEKSKVSKMIERII